MNRISLIAVIFIVLCVRVSGQDEKAVVDSINNLSFTESMTSLYKAKLLYEENLNRARSINYPEGEAKALQRLSVIYYLRGKYDKSTDLNIEAVKIFEALKKYGDLANTYGEYGYQMKRRDIKKANIYMQKGIEIAEKHNVGAVTLSKLYDNYGVLKEMENQPDSSLYYYKKALKMKYENNDSVGIPFSLNKIANAYALKGDFKEAYKYLKKSDEYRKDETTDYGRADNLAYYGDFSSMQGLIDDAIRYYKKSLNLSFKNGYNFLIEYCYKQLADLYKRKNDYLNAFVNFKKYTDYKDSVTNVETNERIAELEIAFESQKKDKLIAEKELTLKQRTLQLFIAAGSVLILVILSFGIYKYQTHKRKTLARELELKAKLAKEKAQRKIVEEKLRISRELHDNIGSQLIFIISSIENLNYIKDNESILLKTKEICQFTRDTLGDLRNTIWAMKNETAELSTLIIKIEEYINHYKQSLGNLSVKVNNRISNEYMLNSIQLLNLFRIFQEALQNVIKHSGANEVEIAFEETDDGFVMSVKDNGTGIILEKTEEGDGLGLSSMKSRCEEAGGRFEIKNVTDSENTNAGTIVICRITADIDNN